MELAQAQRLVDYALPGSSARVFAVPGARGEPGLVAYLTAGGGIRTPEQAHASCLAVLAGDRTSRQPGGIRYTAMTPGRYVICAQQPADPLNLVAWRRQAVLAEGTGRHASTSPCLD
jgi:hypothetical protein